MNIIIITWLFLINVTVNLFEQYEAINDKTLIAGFKGEAGSAFFIEALHQVEGKLEKIEPKVSVRKKIFNILVEILQNIYHYSVETQQDDCKSPTLIYLYKDEHDYWIYTRNQIRNERVIPLKLLLDKINALDKEQLKALYREKLMSGINADTGRAGLGMIDIKRKSGGNILYGFKLLNHFFSHFNFVVKITA